MDFPPWFPLNPEETEMRELNILFKIYLLNSLTTSNPEEKKS